MGTTAQKLEYLGTTKSQLKDQINYGLPTEKQITSSTTFREYVGSIFEAFLEALRNPDTLFTNLPKTSASGSQITLNGTAYAPMRITLNPTAISQETTLGSNLVDFLNPTNVTQGSYDSTTKVYTSNALTGNWKGLNIYVNATPISVPTGNSTFYYSADIRLKSGTYANNISVMRTGTNLTDVTSSVTGTTNPTISSSFQRYVFKVDYVNSSESEVTYVNHYLQLKTNADNAVLEVKNIMVSKTNTDYEIYTYGASPNPSYPQDIHTISGNNSVVVEGKNLCSSAVYYNTNAIYMYFNPKALNKTFTISIKAPKTITGNLNVYLWVDNTNLSRIGYISFTNGEIASTTLTLSDSNYNAVKNGTTAFFSLYLSGAGFDTTGTLEQAQIENNNQATTYTPYVSQTTPINLGEYELGTIGNYSNEFVRVATSDNLFDKNNIIENKRLNGSGVAQSDNGYYVSSFIKVEPNTKYIKNSPSVDAYHRFSYYSSNTESSFISNADSNTATTPSNCQYLRFCGLLTEINTTQLNKGETLLPYVPYEKGWYYKQGIGKVVLDGTEYWGLGTTNVFYTTDITDYATSNNIPMSDYFTGVSNVSGATDMGNKSNNTIGFINSLSNYRFYIKSTDFATETAVKNWLSSNNVTCYYILATPTYTKITGELAQELEQVYKGMLSYDGVTNISQINNDLSFSLSASAITK